MAPLHLYDDGHQTGCRADHLQLSRAAHGPASGRRGADRRRVGDRGSARGPAGADPERDLYDRQRQVATAGQPLPLAGCRRPRRPGQPGAASGGHRPDKLLEQSDRDYAEARRGAYAGRGGNGVPDLVRCEVARRITPASHGALLQQGRRYHHSGNAAAARYTRGQEFHL